MVALALTHTGTHGRPGARPQSARLGRARPGKAPDWAGRSAGKRHLGLPAPGKAPDWARRVRAVHHFEVGVPQQSAGLGRAPWQTSSRGIPRPGKALLCPGTPTEPHMGPPHASTMPNWAGCALAKRQIGPSALQPQSTSLGWASRGEAQSLPGMPRQIANWDQQHPSNAPVWARRALAKGQFG